jgi:Flp pilus assembly protein TadG
MMKLPSFKTFRKAETGAAAVEMAFVLPFMLLLYFGLVDLTGLISFNRKITAVASSTADLVGQNQGTVLEGSITDYFKVSGLIMNPTPDSAVKVRVFVYRDVGGTVTQMWTKDNGKGPGCANAPNVATMKPLMTAGNDLIVAQACMKYEPYVANFMGTSVLGKTQFDVEQIVTLRPRATLTMNCLQSAGGAACT